MIDDDNNSPPTPAEQTGRHLITFSADSTRAERIAALQAVEGIESVASSADAGSDAVGPELVESVDATIFERLGVAVADLGDTRTESLETQAEQNPVILAVEPEHVVHALSVAEASETRMHDGPTSTWGLQATKANAATFDGTGIRVAVLDTGFDLNHPDFAGRTITSSSFVPGQLVQDGHGHGTHCVGTSCGPSAPTTNRRYGIASNASIFVGKVLSNRGSGSDAAILAGIEWALANQCVVVSMSLGADVREPVLAYEEIGKRALAAGTLIIAAAGNNARRPGDPGFVGSPANSPSIMAVGALGPDMRMGSFSARATTVAGGSVDIAAPGVDVYSSWPMPERYNVISGTSMATPHVAGLAALYAQATGKRGRALWDAVAAGAQNVGLPVADVGTGLATAP
ncbi:S8 family serine peptidase [Gordonia sp. ABSL1-1]|uniref:S8 family serine peptidase n=1 Tax=Gordonia sp. ABSL1-1 TaxID=3053923 RepID=UPI002572B22F|nr:S8 family serine peptidase [Gordonia sp. ABSL1-1]MDL9935954.1 S8 family serine peptidase [Gordonia sp. ABSL1-1]